VVHPDLKEVIPLAPEPIIQQDGHTKNDCERNATRRWLKQFREEHPHLRAMGPIPKSGWCGYLWRPEEARFSLRNDGVLQEEL
jgi:hypothetical protein